MTYKLIKWALVVLAALGVLFFIAKVPDTDPALMEAKYGGGDVLRTTKTGMRYRDEGNPSGTVLLLLHGSNSSLQTWEPLVANLKDEFRLVSLDQHGHGLTGPHPTHDYGAQARVDAGVELLDELNIQSAIWVGNSMGGGIAWRAALLAPTRVSGLILIDPSGAQTDEPVTPYLGARLAQTWLGKTILPHITPRFLVAKSLKQSVADPEFASPEMIDRYWEMLRYPGNREAMALAMSQPRESKLWFDIDQIELPTLILWGEQDQVIPVSHAQAFADRMERAEVIVYPHAGHLPMEEIPQEVANDIRAWLTRDTIE